MRLLTGRAGLSLVVGLVGLYAVNRAARGFRNITDSVGITTPDLGPAVTLNSNARGRLAEYVRLGYAVVGPDGTTRITELGEQYIAEQRANQGAYTVAPRELVGPSEP